jgi:outer membrane immunogenic protein
MPPHSKMPIAKTRVSQPSVVVSRGRVGIDMKKFLLSVAAIVSFGSVASAADLPTKGPAPVMARPSCAAPAWQGGYVGINGGGTHWTANRTDQDEVLVDTATYVLKDWGGTVGGHVGYNFARCQTLWGVEVDGAWLSNDQSIQLIPNAPLFNINIQTKFDALVTARLRGGIVVDDIYIYLTGGLAGGHFKTTYTNQFLGIAGVIPGTLGQASFNEWRLGWVGGIGSEWKWTDHWILRSEILYVDFPDRDHTVAFFPGTNATFTHSDSIWISRVGISYKF